MAELINLNRARKSRRRVEQSAAAAQSRAQHGLTKDEREATATSNARADHRLDQHRRED